MELLRYSAFTAGGRGGNPAGVVLDAGGMTADEMQALAAAVGYSETAFAQAAAWPGSYRVRYFSPRREVAFCGHATVAAAVALAERTGTGAFRFETQAGAVPVETFSGPDGLMATLTSVPPRTRPAAPDELAAALSCLGWEVADLDRRFPPHVAFAGNDHLVLAVRSHARLATLRYDTDDLAAVMTERGWTTLHLVWAQTDSIFRARDPFPVGGVGEDPATGSAAAAFGGYLRAVGRLPSDRRLTIWQGEEIGRPSRLDVEVPVDEGTGIRVSGLAMAIPAEDPLTTHP